MSAESRVRFDFGWSAEARLILRPHRTYRELAADDTPGPRIWLLLRRPLLMLLLIGAFVSLTSAGRLVLWHLIFTLGFWAFGPLYQIGLIAGLTLLLARDQPIPRAVDLFFVGHGPWLLFCAVVAGVCLIAPDVYAAFVSLLTWGILPALLGLTFLWSGFTTYAYFRGGLGRGRGRAALGTGLYYLGFWGLNIGYYFATNQLQPLLW